MARRQKPIGHEQTPCMAQQARGKVRSTSWLKEGASAGRVQILEGFPSIASRNVQVQAEVPMAVPTAVPTEV